MYISYIDYISLRTSALLQEYIQDTYVLVQFIPPQVGWAIRLNI